MKIKQMGNIEGLQSMQIEQTKTDTKTESKTESKTQREKISTQRGARST